jgi:hypothetical protein
MSFSGKVKEELSKKTVRSRHCQIAEITAIITLCGNISISARDHYCIRVQTENLSVARKYFTLVQKTFRIGVNASIRLNPEKKNTIYTVVIHQNDDAVRVLKAAKLLDENGGITEELSLMRNSVVSQTCCKHAFLRGAFLATGSMSDPKGSYHLEIVCTTREKAEQLQDIMYSFTLNPKIVKRKKNFIVYLKEGDQIVEMLGMMGASGALMELENIRILKEVRNSVNRQVNCETANLNKTVSAAVKQVEDIQLIQSVMGLDNLSEGLEEIALLRLEHQDATLQELSTMISYPIGKSGVNHRLRKLSKIADRLRETTREDII